MDDHVIGALHERAVDGEKRLEPLRGEPAGEEGRMLLGDADIVIARGMPLLENGKPRSAGHGGGDGDDAVVVVGKVRKFGAEDLRVSRRGG